MNIHLEYIELLPKIYKRLEQIEQQLSTTTSKRWLTTKELGEYLGYSTDAINKMVKDGVLIAGVHYFQPVKKLLFDKEQIDNWIVGIDSKHKADFLQQKIDAVFSDLEI